MLPEKLTVLTAIGEDGQLYWHTLSPDGYQSVGEVKPNKYLHFSDSESKALAERLAELYNTFGPK